MIIAIIDPLPELLVLLISLFGVRSPRVGLPPPLV